MKKTLNIYMFACLISGQAFADPQAKDLAICTTETSVRIQFQSYESDIGFWVSAVSVDSAWVKGLGRGHGPGRITIDTGHDPHASMGLNAYEWNKMTTEIQMGPIAPAVSAFGKYDLYLRQRGMTEFTQSAPIAIGTVSFKEKQFTPTGGTAKNIETCAPLQATGTNY